MVRIQGKGGWQKTGLIVECLPHSRQYKICGNGSGRVTIRNRRYLRQATDIQPTNIMISPAVPTEPSRTSTINVDCHSPTTNLDDALEPHGQIPETLPLSSNRSRLLKELEDHNKKGREEETFRPTSCLRGGKDF